MAPANCEASYVMQEANRCLYCFDAPCIEGCPARVNVPEFVARIRSGDLAGAGKLVYEENPLGWVCGQICPTEDLCAAKCVRGALDGPISIGILQAFACGYAVDHQLVRFHYPSGQLDKRIAVIGGGPAGLSCAHYLRLQSYPVTVFDRENNLGGLLRWGIPSHRLNRAAVDKEIALISSGLQWKRVEVRQSLPNRILTEYDAVFLAPGRWSFPPLAVPGSDLPQVASANIFLKDCAEGNVGSYDLRDKEAAIIGGGSTAIDAARACLEVGARRAIVVYRRGRCEMPACSSEYLSAAEEGVEFVWLSNPVSVSKMGEGLSLELDKMTLGETDESGRRQPTPIGKRTSLLVDRVLVAVSSRPESSSLSGWPELEILNTERPAARCTQNATVPKLFLGGDVIGAGTVVQAVADGKCAAERMHEWLSKQT